MSVIQRIVSDLRTVTEQIRVTDEILIADPGDFGALLAANSLRAELNKLEANLAVLAPHFGVVHCDYRIIGAEETSYTVNSMTASLQAFQRLYSVVFDALEHGKKQRATVPREVAKRTAFQFGYAYSGSLGVVLTLPSEVTLFESDGFDEALKICFEMAQSRDPEQIHHWADEIGVGPVNALHSWVSTHVEYQTSAELIWRKGGTNSFRAFFEAQEFQRLSLEIERTSDETRREFEAEGDLTAADIDSHHFKLRLDDGTYIEGEGETDMGSSFSLQIPQRYRAWITETRSINYAKGEAIVSNFFNRLGPPLQSGLSE